MLSHKVSLLLPLRRAKWIALLPLMNSITCDTAYFVEIAIILRFLIGPGFLHQGTRFLRILRSTRAVLILAAAIRTQRGDKL